jgi:hypothetical protein
VFVVFVVFGGGGGGGGARPPPPPHTPIFPLLIEKILVDRIIPEKAET